VGKELFGLAKLVSGPEISRRRFQTFVRLLEVFIAQPCQDLHVQLLSQEIETLHASLRQLGRVKPPGWPVGVDQDQPETSQENTDNDGPIKVQTLVSRVLEYLRAHHTDPMLSLSQVAHAVGKNEKYVAHLFAQQVGMRMRTYVTMLRVQRVCALLLQSRRTIEEVAHDSGFTCLHQFRHSFRQAIGVTACEYRQIFGVGPSETLPDPPPPVSSQGQRPT